MAQNESVPPQPQAQLGGQSERQLYQWMQLQQNRIDNELQVIRQTLVKIEKVQGVLAERTQHMDRKIQENAVTLNSVAKNVDKISTQIAVGIAVVISVGTVVAFVLGSDISEIAKAVQVLSAAKDSK